MRGVLVIMGVLLFVKLVGGVSGSKSGPSPVGPPAPSGHSESISSNGETAKADEKRKGFHCLSPWDGSDRDVVRLVKKDLRDPDSFEHDETRISPENQGKHLLVMIYHAKNGFGGYNKAAVTAILDHETCRVISITPISD